MRLDPPLDPTSPQARQWLEDELRRGVYREQPGLLSRAWDWLQDLLGRGASTGGLPPWTLGVAVVIAVAVLAVVVARSVAAERRMAPSGGPRGVLDGPARTADEHRAAARQALASGDEESAVLESYRALARAAIERTILDDQPGRTAHEVAIALTPVFPAATSALTTAADDFDAVRYGERDARPGAASAILALDADLAGTRPVLPDPVTGRAR